MVAFDGSIMLSSKQTKGRKQEDLPNNIIIYAKPNQFTVNINEALQKLNSRKDKAYIRQHLSVDVTSQCRCFSASKNIYLLLVEQY